MHLSALRPPEGYSGSLPPSRAEVLRSQLSAYADASSDEEIRKCIAGCNHRSERCIIAQWPIPPSALRQRCQSRFARVPRFRVERGATRFSRPRNLSSRRRLSPGRYPQCDRPGALRRANNSFPHHCGCESAPRRSSHPSGWLSHNKNFGTKSWPVHRPFG